MVLTYAATHEGWHVPLVGDSRRWAAGAVLLLGMGACRMGSQMSLKAMLPFAFVGMLAFSFGVLAVWTGSLTSLSLLVLCNVVLFVMSALRHAVGLARHPVASA